MMRAEYLIYIRYVRREPALKHCDSIITIWPISYKIDGASVTPEGSSITFPNKGKHILQIEIEETPERKWEIEYKLNVD